MGAGVENGRVGVGVDVGAGDSVGSAGDVGEGVALGVAVDVGEGVSVGFEVGVDEGASVSPGVGTAGVDPAVSVSIATGIGEVCSPGMLPDGNRTPTTTRIINRMPADTNTL
jgi:UDP-3-O-[3-hydroxymyristoyl] glucosamine N-acyltransferase